MDFYLGVGLFQDVKDNLDTLCKAVRAIDIKDPEVAAALKNYYPENIVNNDSTIVSGMDIFPYFNPKNTTESSYYNHSDINCPKSLYKYICYDFNPDLVPEYYKRWKEVAFVREF